MNHTPLAAAGLVVNLVIAACGFAQSDSDNLLEGQVQRLQAEVDRLHSRLDDSHRLVSLDNRNVAYAEGGFSNDGCDERSCMGSPPCNSEDCSRFTFGFDFVFLQPRFIESFDVQQTNPVTGVATLLPLDFNYSLAPRFHLGYKTNGDFSVRARYWDYDDQVNRSLTSGPAVLAVQQLASIFPATVAAVGGDTLSVSNSFRTETLDVEAAYDVNILDFEISGSLGVRYSELEQSRQATVTGVFPQSLDFRREYRGFGLLAGADVRRPIGDWGLAVVLRERGSVVHGNKTLNRSVTGTFPPALPTPPPTPPVVSLENANETSLIGEIGLGLEMHRELGRFDVFSRVMYENRFWTAASTPALGLAGFEGFSVGLEAAF